jgi:uncharacterized membrane protein
MTLEESARDNIGKERLVDQIRGSVPQLPNERWISIIAGSALLLRATTRRSLSLALAGGILVYRGAAGHWPFTELFGLSASDDRRHRRTSVPHETGIKIERSVVINKTPEELYRFWRDLENLPRFMSQLDEVRRLDDKRSHWKLKTVAGATLEWDAEIINEVPNELLAWRSLPASDIDHAGSVHFEPAPQGGTKVRVVMEYRPPAGKVGAEIARLIGQDPAQILEKDLYQLKQMLEAGEIPSVAAQSHVAGA